jgi:hypothetical protein
MVKNEKVYELKIEEDDAISGIDSISLVSEPAIEVNWIAFKKEAFAGLKVSFDYDDTLSTNRGQELAKRLISEGNDVHIVTRRNIMQSGQVYKTAQELGIPKDNVHFTNGKLKWETIKRLGIQKHYDNNSDEIKAIRDNAPLTQAIKFDFGLPLFETIEDAEKYAISIGCEGHHEHIVGDKTLYMPCKEHPQDMGYDVGAIGGYVDPGIIKKKKKQSSDIIPKSLVPPSMFEAEPILSQFAEVSKQRQDFATDEEKHIVLGPAMVPDMRIFRKDALGNPYHVFFSSETIKMIAEKYMRNKYIDNNDTEHNGKAASDVYVVESWIKEDENDKSIKYGFGDLPIGTWFVAMKVRNPQVWQDIKDKKLNGFSVSGYFEEVAAFCREEMFLQEVIDILNNVQD